MSTILWIAFAYAVVHFVYESILAPSIRMDLRAQLFALRDRVRSMRFEEEDPLDEMIFDRLHSAINYFANNLHHLSLVALALCHTDQIKGRTPKEEADFSAWAKRIEQSNDPRISEIYQELGKVVEKAFKCNTFTWFIYLVPVFICLKGARKLNKLFPLLTVSHKSDRDQVLGIAGAPA